jgi:non-specific serine/threonine protein kinase
MAVAREDEPHIMDAHHGLADVALYRGDFGQAEAHFTQALQRAAEFRDPMRCIFQLEGLAMASSGRAQHRRAIVLAAAASSARKTIGSDFLPPSWETARAAALASASKALGSPASARARSEGAQLELEQVIPYALRKAELEDVLGAHGDGASVLTRREARIAELVSSGMTSAQIARRLGISARTVDAHAEHIRGKLGAHSRAQIAAWVARQAHPVSEEAGSVAHSQF